ncbi:permease [Oceanicola sp. 22II-s10i]|nr:permease [Oceanicola sp. 22II-s10i]
MELSPAVLAVTWAAVVLIAFVKGAFGGGLAMVGIPVMSLAMDPLVAGAVLAPLFLVMDACALLVWRPSTWSRREVVPILPAMLAGTVAGTFLLAVLDHRAISVLLGIVSIAFFLLWLRGSGRARHDHSTPGAMAAGFGSGVTSMVAHAGGPPLAIYLLGLGLPKGVYAGTTSIVFTIGNIAKVAPWLWLKPPTAPMLWLMAAAAPVIPLAIWAGWRLHNRLDQATVYRLCYGLLALAGVKLLWDGIGGYL